MIHLEGSKGYATPDILEMINIPQYDPNNDLHSNISKTSTEIHVEIKKKEKNIEILENKLNNYVIELYNEELKNSI